MFAAVVMLSNPGVDVPLPYTPTLALVMGSLALVASWLAAVRRTALRAFDRSAPAPVRDDMRPC